MSTPELRPMGIGDILDATFRLYRQRFMTFLFIALVVLCALCTCHGGASGSCTGTLAVGRAGPGQPWPEPLRRFLDAARAMRFSRSARRLLCRYFVGIALFRVGHFSALPGRDDPQHIGQLLGRDPFGGRLLCPSGAAAVPAAMDESPRHACRCRVGLVLCIVPGIIFVLWFLVAVPVVLLERIGGPTAMGRSRELMRGNISKGFVLMFVVGILGWILNVGSWRGDRVHPVASSRHRRLRRKRRAGDPAADPNRAAHLALLRPAHPQGGFRSATAVGGVGPTGGDMMVHLGRAFGLALALSLLGSPLGVCQDSWRWMRGPKARPFAQPRATPWGAGSIRSARRPNGPMVR